MSADQFPPPEGGSPPPNPSGDPGPYTQEIRHSHVSARVPEKVGRGVFSTGALVLQGPHEFVIDFVVRMANPHQVAARAFVKQVVSKRGRALLAQAGFGLPKKTK